MTAAPRGEAPGPAAAPAVPNGQPSARGSSPRLAGLAIFAALAALYAASLAPRVTFWDAGEFIAAVQAWGIPHPPGTPLYVTLGRAAAVLFRGAPLATVINAMSALCTAAACASGGWLLARRGASGAAAIAAGLCAGSMTSVWLSATEAEVYSASLLLSVLMLIAAHSAAARQAAGDEAGGSRGRALLVYLFALAAPLHASALVAGPAAIWLAIDPERRDVERGGERLRHAAVLVAALVAAGALATGRFRLAAVAAIALGGLVAARRSGAGRALLALALGATPLVIMLLRARHDPAINQGNPATWQALADVIGRRQYEVAGLFPRQAPPWIQLANFFQYADWQVALGLAPESTPSALRLVVSLCFVVLGVTGARVHRARDPRAFRALLVLLLGASIGIIGYLNLKAGPSIGWGILPDSAPHEARERDYFFALAFWAWGLWAGYGAVAIATRRLSGANIRAAAVAGLAVAALPALFNWQAMNRRREPDASIAALLADVLLRSAPPNGVLLVWGDNDSYPLWEAQRALGTRRDVTVVTSPLLGASWYRDELRRRWALDAGALGPERSMVGRVIQSARRIGRPVAIGATVPANIRAAIGGRWTLCGAAWIESSGRCAFEHSESIDNFLRAHPITRFTDNTVRSMAETLRCPGLASRASSDSAAVDSLARACNAR